MARKHAKRNTLQVEDIRFARFMTQVGDLGYAQFENCFID
jgi:hypothetical protein